MKIKPYIIIALLAGLLFIPFLGKVHLFDWDEINFAESAREMIVTGNYSRVEIDYKPFWEKPPLFIWMQVGCMKLFGISEFAARLPNAICGIITLWVLFWMGSRIFNERFGWIWVLCYAGSFLPQFYFHSGIIDPWFNLFMFLGIAAIMRLSFDTSSKWVERKRMGWITLAGMFIGLAILTKGPVGLLIPVLTLIVYVLIKRQWKLMNALEFFWFLLVAAIVSSVWYGFEVAKDGWWFMEEFIDYHLRLAQTGDSGHGQPFYYHFVVVFLGCFPASIFFFVGLKNRAKMELKEQAIWLWMLILFLVVMILFSLVKTKIVHYSSMSYFPLSFLAAYGLYLIYDQQVKISKWVIGFVAFLGGLFAMAFTILPLVGRDPQLLIPYIKDDFAVANLAADVTWPLYLVVPGLVFTGLLVASLILLHRQEGSKGIITLFGGSGLMLTILMWVIVPKIEPYSQGAAIEFMQKHADEDAYINVLSYKSYAQYYYGNKRPEDVASPLLHDYIQQKLDNGEFYEWPDSKQFMEQERQWHLKGDIDKPVYFVTKNVKAQQYREMSQLKEIGSKNGFVFFKREPPQ